MLTVAVIATIASGSLCVLPAAAWLLVGRPLNQRLWALAAVGVTGQVWWIGLFAFEFYRSAFAV